MSQDWTLPTLTSLYADVVDIIKGRDVDAATMVFDDVPTGISTGTLRYVVASNKFQRWSGAAWVDLLLAVAGGGTGAASASGARSNLGLGTIAIQDANNVTITGGSITALTTFTFACNLVPTTDNARNLGSNSARMNTVYINTGLTIPVGTNKYVSS